MREARKFKFTKKIGKKAIERELGRAIENAEYMFGKARVRLEAGYAATADRAVIETTSEVGENIAKVFTGIMIEKVGEANFTIERMPLKEPL